MSRRRLLFRLVTFLVVIPTIIYVANLRWNYLKANSYALTISAGNGYGFTVFNPSYYELPEIAQEVIRAHEENHLQEGTWKFWKNQEAIALQAEIDHIQTRKAQLEAFIRKSDNRRSQFLFDYRVLELLEKSSEVQLGQQSLCGR